MGRPTTALRPAVVMSLRSSRVAMTAEESALRISLISGKAVLDPTVSNLETDRIAFDAQVGKVTAALMTDYTRDYINTAAWNMPSSVDAEFAANNADMVDFTILEWYDNGDGQFDVEPGHFGTQLEFLATACESMIT